VISIEIAAMTAFLLSFSACGGSGSGSQTSPPPQPQAINGTQITSYTSETGTTNIPDDLSSTPIAAYVPNASGGYTVTQGSGQKAGTFTIPILPSGYYLLQVGTNYFWTNSNTMDTGKNAQGQPASNGINAQVQFNVNLAIPTQPTDDFVLYVPNVPTGFDYYPQYSQPQTVFNYPGIWEAAPVDSSKGDRSYLLHLKAPSAPFSTGLTLNQEMTGPMSLNISNGNTTNVQTSTSPAGASFRANFAISKFASYANQMLVTTYLNGYTFYTGVEAVPPQATQGGITTGLNDLGILATFNYQATAVASDVDEGNVSYANSFPSSYATVFFADLQVSDYYFVSALFPATLTAHMTINTLSPISDTQSLTPLLSPITGLTVDGGDAFAQNLNNVNLQPTLQWNPPALGTPNFYCVQVIHIYAAADRQYTYAATQVVAQIQTSTNTLVLPPNILSPTSQYLLRITACNATSLTASAPLKWTYPFACTDTLSHIFSTTGP
jgi:hypothetical protein